MEALPPHEGSRVEASPPAATPGYAAAAFSEYELAVRDMTRLNQLFAILSEPAPIQAMVDRVLLALSELFAADVVLLLQLDRDGGLRLAGSIGLPEGSTIAPATSTQDHLAEAIHRRAPVLVSGTAADPATEAHLRDLGVETAAWLPVLGSSEVLGALVLGRCQPLPFCRSDADLLMSMAHRIGLVLGRAQADEDRRLLEARLRQAEKSESLGRMAGAIAHHFNNKLTAVMGWLEVGIDEVAAGRNAALEMSRALEAARQAATIGELMLAYLGQGFGPRETADLGAVSRRILDEVRPALPSNARLGANLPESPLLANVSEADIRQVLENLVVNAAEALPRSGGEILVTVAAVHAIAVDSSPFVSPDWVPRAERYARIEVRDDGCGMTSDQIGNAFDPFFTTKFPGRGLGLAVASGIVRAHDGTISVRSEPGRGSAFRVFLPLVAQGSPAR